MKRSERSSAKRSRRSGQADFNGRGGATPQAGEELTVAQKAAAYCVLHFPTLWTAGLPHWEPAKRRWIVPVVVRYPTGDECELGELAFDRREFTLLTSRDKMAARARTIEEDPTFRDRWHEKFPTAIPPRTT